MTGLVVNSISSEIMQEINSLMVSVWWGMVFAFVYDSIRIMRRVIRHKTLIFTCIEDILYGIYLGIRSFIIFFKTDDGVIRGFILAGFIIGAALFNYTLGVIYIKYTTRLLNFLLHPLKKCIIAFRIQLRKLRLCMEDKHAAGIKKRKTTAS